MSKVLQSIGGMNDILPPETQKWCTVENTLRTIVESYGYQEIRLPIVEYTRLFTRAIGEGTDIVEKEMYTFLDRDNDQLTLRPEGTASCVRSGMQHGFLHNQQQRLWYMGPMFRHEKQQKGRYRQFHQFGVEAFGMPGPDIDSEIILLTARFWKALGIEASEAQLHLNSLGDLETRKIYRQVLQDYFAKYHDQLDGDSQRRLTLNPLRILDSKNPKMAALIQGAPKLLEYLDKDSRRHFERLCENLTYAGLSYHLNPCLVRGLDYYSKTVFEWTTTHLGAQNAICGGGRYDGLVALMGGQPTPAFGFAIGMERLIEVLRELHRFPDLKTRIHFYVVIENESLEKEALKFAETLRTEFPSLKLEVNAGGGNLKTQFKRADQREARMALLLTEAEFATHTVSIKFLREDKPQLQLSLEKFKEFLHNLLA